MNGRLSIVATPIGDPDDISKRALRCLAAADLIAAEDTRVARDRLRDWGIEGKKLLSYWDQNEQSRVPELIEQLQEGKNIALISDAGTPLISDPGFRIVQACVAAGLTIEVIPGPCAAVAALAGSGLPTDRFYFGGFLPREAGPRRRSLEDLASLRATLIFYESPLRLAESLATIAELWPSRRVVAARNLTGPWEQWLHGTAEQVRSELGEERRGEVTLLIESSAEVTINADSLDAQIDQLLGKGHPLKEVRDLIASATGLPKRDIYQRILARSGKKTEA